MMSRDLVVCQPTKIALFLGGLTIIHLVTLYSYIVVDSESNRMIFNSMVNITDDKISVKNNCRKEKPDVTLSCKYIPFSTQSIMTHTYTMHNIYIKFDRLTSVIPVYSIYELCTEFKYSITCYTRMKFTLNIH